MLTTKTTKYITIAHGFLFLKDDLVYYETDALNAPPPKVAGSG